jgi:hypothetical protein
MGGLGRKHGVHPNTPERFQFPQPDEAEATLESPAAMKT